MKVKVVTKRYAEVEFDFRNFRVHSYGDVERWDGESWKWLDETDEDYEFVREEGLKALEETK